MADKDTAHNLLGVRIRRGVPEDAAALEEFGRRLFVETFADLNDPENLADYVRENYNTARQTAELCSEDEITLLAVLDDSLIGYAQVRKNPPPTDIRLKEPLELHRFYVDSLYHGSGLAQRLMAEVLVSAGELGGHTIWLSVWEQNPRAIHFYAKMGFADVGSKDFWLGSDRQSDRVMALRIDQ